MEAFSFLTSGAFWLGLLINACITFVIVLIPVGSAIKSLRSELSEYADNLARDQRSTKEAVEKEAAALRAGMAEQAGKLSDEHKIIREAELGEQKVISTLLETINTQSTEAAKRGQELTRLHEENLQLKLNKSMSAEQETEN